MLILCLFLGFLLVSLVVTLWIGLSAYVTVDMASKLTVMPEMETKQPLNAVRAPLTLFIEKCPPMSEERPKFEDLCFSGHDGGVMPICRPAAIHKLDAEGCPLDFTGHGRIGNVRDIIFTSQVEQMDLGPGLTKYWYKIHPLLCLPEA